ncbi:MAG TPA: DUF2225 domain-containing protein [Clostridiales bacterium]|nr:DUF2225 domain-containing protein [Clostridiales bacterium]
MSNLFSGLEDLGLKKASKVDVYKNEEDKDENDKGTVKKEEIKDTDFLFLKTHICPVCENEFKESTVKTGSIKLSSVDTDLRPKYDQLDGVKYGVTLCNKCGYAALNQLFKKVTSIQCKLVREQISSTYKPIEENKDSLKISYDDAILRHKLALLNTVVKKGKNSERAYTCLKTAWVLRGKAEEIEKSMQEETDKGSAKAMIAELKKEEDKFIINAFEGFSKAYSTEGFPISGMDMNTLSYLLGDLARRICKYDEASRWISEVIVSRSASKRLKDSARNIKELLAKEKK